MSVYDTFHRAVAVSEKSCIGIDFSWEFINVICFVTFIRAIINNADLKEHKDRINFLMDKGTKDRIKLAADKKGQTSSEFIREAIEAALFAAGIEKSLSVEDPGIKKWVQQTTQYQIK